MGPVLLNVFWIIVGLVGVLLLRNAHYAVREYFRNRNKIVLSIYMTFLIALGVIVTQLTYRLIEFVQAAQEGETLQMPFAPRAPRPIRPLSLGPNENPVQQPTKRV